MRKIYVTGFLVAATIALIVFRLAPVSRSAVPVPAGFVRVTKVFDGDTIAVALPGGEKHVRLLGVNTPETVDPHRPVQCYGPEASHFAKTTVGPVVRLETDPTRDEDKYHRLLRYVYLPDGTLFNQRLIEEGYGQEYTYQNQSYAHQVEFKRAEAVAKAGGKGLWSRSTCDGNIQQSPKR